MDTKLSKNYFYNKNDENKYIKYFLDGDLKNLKKNKNKIEGEINEKNSLLCFFIADYLRKEKCNYDKEILDFILKLDINTIILDNFNDNLEKKLYFDIDDGIFIPTYDDEKMEQLYSEINLLKIDENYCKKKFDKHFDMNSNVFDYVYRYLSNYSHISRYTFFRNMDNDEFIKLLKEEYNFTDEKIYYINFFSGFLISYYLHLNLIKKFGIEKCNIAKKIMNKVKYPNVKEDNDNSYNYDDVYYDKKLDYLGELCFETEYFQIDDSSILQKIIYFMINNQVDYLEKHKVFIKEMLESQCNPLCYFFVDYLLYYKNKYDKKMLDFIIDICENTYIDLKNFDKFLLDEYAFINNDGCLWLEEDDGLGSDWY